MEKLTQKMNLQNSWNQDEIDHLAKALTFVYKNQKTYAQPLDLADRVLGWQFVLDGKYSMDSVLNALKRYMTEKPDMPAPADIVAIIDPPTPRITAAEFIHAKEQHKLEGYPSHGYYGGIIRQYEKENAEERGSRPMTDEGTKLLTEAMKQVR